tara:strand:+ start:162 stop:608 length:447 start_codon:yes stop_codon:yes gene_type:complete
VRGIVKNTKSDSILRKVLDKVQHGYHGKVYSRMWFKTMNKRRNALGFSANQLNMNQYAFLALINNKWAFFANPVIVRASDKTIKDVEGCLSIPNVQYEVTRHDWVELDWEDRQGNGHTEKFKGLNAVIIQHEIDHLNGVLIGDKGEKK